MNIKELMDYTGQILEVERFHDYCPNGLQVEGRREVSNIVTGVTASMALLQAAQQAGADMVLVHHGYFWRNEDPRIIGIKHKRIRFLLEHQLNLVAYHLPLDAHPVLGNNVQLGLRLGLQVEGSAGEQSLVLHGTLPHAETLDSFQQRLGALLQRQPLVVSGSAREVQRVAWCTGAAQQHLETAIELGVDVFISGEVSEQTVHLARESGVAYIAAGHHATERYGVQALGRHLAEQFGLKHQFIDIDNPV
ncbi:MAG: Nif3-like dinuclear metal center hexameric protein [Betaproteobacteria bacterium HGW-Betaproteobacteria-1]|jgi:dinuclear metal center YbgI/SA1388 family protein|nr:MAG: Nif3-like dinuclear metal center hexameric protein [Betaproteobacteria bacterium HGW-Betaproteobacteria-1]